MLGIFFFLPEGDYKVAMSFMQIKSEVHVVAEIACHQTQSVEMKSTQAYGIHRFVRFGGQSILFSYVLTSMPGTFIIFFLVKCMHYHCNVLNL